MLGSNFTPRAKQVIIMAEMLAGPLGCEYVGTEHLLLAMTKLEGSEAQKILASFGVTEKALLDCHAKQ